MKSCEILLAEDNPADAEMVRVALREHEIACTLHLVEDGGSALELLNRLDRDANAPRLDLVILDMHLPKHDGEEILKGLRSTKRYAQTPVIVMSGVSSRIIEEETATKYAALVYFTKPASVTEYMRLGSIVRDVLRQTGGAA